jgi:excisionase family DNA binding protein
MNDIYYTVEQVSEMLHIHPKTIQRYIREGKLAASKIGKSWRITGHDLSVFMEGSPKKPAGVSGAVVCKENVKISSVIDMDGIAKDDAMRIVNLLTASMNSKPPEFGQTSMHAQFIESEEKVRVTLWGGLDFVSFVLNSIAVFTDEKKDGDI